MIITYNTEIKDTVLLSNMIKKEGWVDEDTILINCSPSYSCIMGQVLQHSIGNRSLNDMIYLSLPANNTSQVWDPVSNQYIKYDSYIYTFLSSLDRETQYLFFSSYIGEGKIFSRINSLLKGKDVEYKTACLYLSSPSFTPDYYVQTISPSFEWEKVERNKQL